MAKVFEDDVGEKIQTQSDYARVLVAEFICTFFFVFVGVGSVMAAETIVGEPLLALFFVAVAHPLALAAMISCGLALTESGVHLDPAVTIGLAIGGHVMVFRAIPNCKPQLLASVLACVLLKCLSGGLAIPAHTLPPGVQPLQGVIWETVFTFSLVFTVFATLVDPRSGLTRGLGAILTGFVMGANVLAAGSFSRASMNPARSFGPSLVSGIWTDHWVYWIGPIVGGSLAGLVYETFSTANSLVL